MEERFQKKKLNQGKEYKIVLQRHLPHESLFNVPSMVTELLAVY